MSETQLEELMRHSAWLHGLAESLVKDPAAADDLVQDTCERAITRADQFETGTRFESWLFSIMQSIWTNKLRAEKVRDADGDDALAAVPDDLAHHRPEDKVALTQLDRLILELPDGQRVVLALISIEGHSYKEASEMLELPMGTVMSRLSRARIALAKAYNP